MAAGSFCDGRGDGQHCNGTRLVRCADGDVSFALVCSTACTPSAQPACAFDLPECARWGVGSFCVSPRPSARAGADATPAVVHCGLDGSSLTSPCAHGCETLGDSSARCFRPQRCARVPAQSLRFCPRPRWPVPAAVAGAPAAAEEAARRAVDGLPASGGACVFTAVELACAAAFPECPGGPRGALGLFGGDACHAKCAVHNQCLELIRSAERVNCDGFCGSQTQRQPSRMPWWLQ
eukprot:m51a1_g8368 hypothetical protein (236) ;mRNA; f:143618-144510